MARPNEGNEARRARELSSGKSLPSSGGDCDVIPRRVAAPRKRSFMQPPRQQEPPTDYLLRIAAIVLGVTIGTQVMMAAFVLVPKPMAENFDTKLSDVGRRIY